MERRLAGHPAPRRAQSHRALLFVHPAPSPQPSSAGIDRRVRGDPRGLLGTDDLRASVRDRGGVLREGREPRNWIDEQYLPGRKWNGAWDPEGLLTTLPAIGTCLLGVFAGLLLKEPKLQPHQKTLWMIGYGHFNIHVG